MGRKPCCAKEGLNKGTWSVMEDEILINYVGLHGEGKWRDLPHRAGLKRCGKSCRLRWLNYLRPNIKRGDISEDEEELIARLHRLLGNRWALIAGRLPGRTDNEIKNYWNTYLCKRVRTDNESGQARFNGNRSMVSRETHRAIRTKAVRCVKPVFPQPLGMGEGHGICTDPTNNENPPTSRHWENGADENFLVDFNIDELLVPETLPMGSDPLAREGKGVGEHGGATTSAEVYIGDIPPCPSPVPAGRLVGGGEHFDPNCKTSEFNDLLSLLSADDSEMFAP